MKDQVATLLRRVWAQFIAFTPGQKIVTVVSALALFVGGYFFLTWKSAQPYAPLYTNLAASDASAIVDKLNSAGISYQLGQAGTEILVPQNEVYSTRLTVSAAGLPSSDQTGYSLLDKEGVTTSDFQQQVDYQRAIEGELDKTIESMTGVQNASVHLAIPQQNVFNDGSQKPTAAVLLTTSSGVQLTSQQVQSLVYLVSSSVPDLSSDAVTITDNNGQLLAAPGDNIASSVGVSTRDQATQAYDQQEQQKIESLLTPLVGAGHAVVTVDAQLDFSKTNTTKRTYVVDPSAPPLSEQKSVETYTGAGSGPNGILGSAPSSSATASTTPGGKYTKTDVTRDNALGTKVQTSESAPGAPTKQSVAVLLDSAVKGVSLSKVRALLNSAALINSGDKLSIQAMPFNTSAATAAAKQDAAAQQAAAAQATQQRMFSLIKQGGFAGLVLAVLLGTWIASRRRRKLAAPPAEPDDVPEIFDPPVDPTPPLAEQPLTAPPSPEVEEAAARRRALATLAGQQPREVASVLSGWLGGKNDFANDHARSSW